VNIFNCVGRQTLHVAAFTRHDDSPAKVSVEKSNAAHFKRVFPDLVSLSTNVAAMDYANHAVLRALLRRSMQSNEFFDTLSSRTAAARNSFLQSNTGRIFALLSVIGLPVATMRTKFQTTN